MPAMLNKSRRQDRWCEGGPQVHHSNGPQPADELVVSVVGAVAGVFTLMCEKGHFVCVLRSFCFLFVLQKDVEE